jgi:hypothetical protein
MCRVRAGQTLTLNTSPGEILKPVSDLRFIAIFVRIVLRSRLTKPSSKPPNRPALGFSDCLILEIARKAGHLPLGTFDRDRSKLKYADKTDAEISRYVEQAVDERLERYEKAGQKSKGLVSLSGALAPADQPRDRQIAAGVEYFTKVREHQRQIKQAMKNWSRQIAKDKKRGLETID